MNKKFSTLVASLLLASCIGTAGAQTTPVYSMFKQAGIEAETLDEKGAFQLADNNGKVLAMVRQEDGKYVLKMVENDGTTKLAETLWTVRWTKDGVKKYYFTFQSAAYNMPLSFSTENAGKGTLSVAANYEFPGKIGTWEWQEGIEEDGIKGATALKYRFANPDSVMTLATNADGKVGAIKYAQAKETQVNALSLKPMVASSVTLTAADLNSTMLSNTAAGKFRLKFDEDVKGGPDTRNLWTASDLIAEPVFAHSTSMFKQGDVPAADPYNENQKAAAKAAKAAADALVVPATVEGAVQTAIAAGSAWTAPVAAWATGVKAAATTEEGTFVASLEAVQNAVALKKAEVAKDAALSAAATAINAVVAAYEMEAIDGTANTDTKVNTIITAATVAADLTTEAAADNKAAFDVLFTAEVVITNGTEAEYTASVTAVNALAAKFAGMTVDAGITTADGLTQWLDNRVDADIKAFVTTMTTGLTTTDAIQIEVDKLIAAAEKITAAIAEDGNAFVAAEDAWDLARFKAEYAKITYATTTDYTEAQFTEVKDANEALINQLPTAVGAADQAQKVVADQDTKYAATSTASAAYTAAVNGITTAVNSMNSVQTVKDAILVVKESYNDEGDAIITRISNDVIGANLVAAVVSVDITKYLAPGSTIGTVLDEDAVASYVSLYLGKGEGANKEYLAVDTALLTVKSGNRHLRFAAWTYKGDIKNSNGDKLREVNNPLFRDYNGRFNFKFTYYPTEDSLKIETDGYAMKPAVGFDNWVDIPAYMVEETHNYDANGKYVKVAVLAKDHREVTVGRYEKITGSSDETINTRIGFGINFQDYVAITPGVYTIKYVSNDEENAKSNGRYITNNWLQRGQYLASVEDQELNHIPAAQWIVTQAKGEKLNSIVNRESAESLIYKNEFGDVQQQYMYATATKNLYKNMNGDSLLFTEVPKEFTTSSTLGYFANPENNEAADDQLKVFSLKYLNNLNADLFVGYNGKDSILNVAKTDAEDLIHFRLIRATTDSINYGAAEVKDIAKQLKHLSYYLQLETANKNIKDEDKLFITVDKDGKYKLINSTLTKNAAGNMIADHKNLNAFFLKEFKEADTHYYALIEANKLDANETWAWRKISVKDYPSILVQEDLEGENQPEYANWGGDVDGRTSTFALVEKDAPKYRRLGVTNAEDGLNNMGTNVSKINVTREPERYLYENSANKVAGYEKDPQGIDYLGALFNGKDTAALFIDTAYVRNETARPQYLLAVRPDFTPVLVDCETDPSHAKHEVSQVRANYLITLSDSVAAYATNKPMRDKFRFETYTRLAFVDAIHRGDSLFIMSSKYTGTADNKKDTINLSKNAFNNAAVQFRLTKNDDQTAEFYIETQNNEFVRLVNGVAVLTKDIADAERFNIAKTDDKPVSNEGVNASKVTVVATNGAVIINGAQGKAVSISNVLGQIIARTVLSSDNATIAAPTGVVIVAVEGEDAVKAIVK